MVALVEDQFSIVRELVSSVSSSSFSSSSSAASSSSSPGSWTSTIPQQSSAHPIEGIRQRDRHGSSCKMNPAPGPCRLVLLVAMSMASSVLQTFFFGCHTEPVPLWFHLCSWCHSNLRCCSPSCQYLAFDGSTVRKWWHTPWSFWRL